MDEPENLSSTEDIHSSSEDSEVSFSLLHPPKIGRYTILRRLGKGGFGEVYLAFDDELDRPVAIKVPRPERVSQPEDIEVYLTEARIVASLDHPHIVPVYDAGRTDDGLCFVVSKLIEGSDLAKKIKENRLGFHESAALVATVAEALHFAHTKGLVHRDIKPGNILIDTAGKPYVADFGLALKEEDFGKGGGLAGTPSYMSPEQAKGEGHRVDGRSDIFSLGVVFYELLTGRRPFRAESHEEIRKQIITVEPRPPRQINDSIPKELEHICQKALSKSLSRRYTTARDMAEDLRQYQQAQEVRENHLATLASHNLIHASEPVDYTKLSGRIRRLEIKSLLGRTGCLIQITMTCSVLFGLMILSHEISKTFEERVRVEINRVPFDSHPIHPIEIITHGHIDNRNFFVAILLITLPCIFTVHRLWQRLQKTKERAEPDKEILDVSE